SHEFYCKLSADVCSYLDTATSEGVLYRVDARLRPEGQSGVMARSLSGYAMYFVEQARSWEKIAYLKARCVSGDERVGGEFARMAMAFVLMNNRHDILLPEVARLKRRIDHEAEPDDIKRGPGGIREIEFIAAALQLLHGTTDPEVRVRATLRGLERLV